MSLLLAAGKNHANPNYDPTAVLNIDFTNAAVGSQTFTDIGTGARTFTRHLIGSGSTSDGVVNDATFGKCYKFTGNVYFSCSNVLQFSNINYKLTVNFVPQSNAAIEYLFMTGDYSASYEYKGASILLNQFAGQYIQYFQCQGTGPISQPYTRMYPGAITYPSSPVLETVIITNQNGTTTLQDTRTNTSSSAASFNTTGDTYLYFGTSAITLQSSFIGLLKSLKIQLL